MRYTLGLAATSLSLIAGSVLAQTWTDVPLQSQADGVNPMTGLVAKADSDDAKSDAYQLEFSYLLYRDVVNGDGQYDWSSIDALLDRIAARGHQAVLRFRFVYPGFEETAVPDSIKKLPDYHETNAESEGKPTKFCDWSHPQLQQFALGFHTRFAERYDQDRRLAFLQVGFGLWAEYHIYDGPMELGKTFPSKTFQTKFLKHLDNVFTRTPWSISIDAAEAERTPMAQQPDLLKLGFGLFDDSFLHSKHDEYNQTCWQFFGDSRWQHSPAGGEFSYYSAHDQEHALAEDGPHSEPFCEAAKRFHITYMFAFDQSQYRTQEEIRDASRSLGYRLRIDTFQTDGARSRVTITNTGIAPVYYDAYPAIGERRSSISLKGLLPGKRRSFIIDEPSRAAKFSIQSDRLVEGQHIGFDR